MVFQVEIKEIFTIFSMQNYLVCVKEKITGQAIHN